MPQKDCMADNQKDETPRELPGVGIRVEGQLVAWFADPELAYEWASENYPGQWLAHPCAMPDRPAFTSEQLEQARREAEELWAYLNADDSLKE